MDGRFQSLAEQTAAWLRQRLADGRWGVVLPGVPSLARECGVAEKTMRQAVLVLEHEGAVVSAGNGRRRMVVARGAGTGAGAAGAKRRVRVGVLLRDRMENEDESFQICMRQAQTKIEEQGHVWTVLPKTLAELKDNDERAMKLLEQAEVDARLVAAGSRRLLEWLVRHRPPAFAFGGAWTNLPGLAAIGSLTLPTHLAMIRRLVELRHRRIVFMLPRFVRGVNEPSSTVRCLVAEMAAHGIQAGQYNFPDWDETPAGLQERLAAIFRISPPSAIFATLPTWVSGILSFLARRGLRVPDDVSVVCGNEAGFLRWHTPEIGRYHHDDRRITRRIVQWVDNVACGRPDSRQTFFRVRLEEGQSIGPAR